MRESEPRLNRVNSFWRVAEKRRWLGCTCGNPDTDWDAPLVVEDGVDTDQVLDPGLKPFDRGGSVVSWHGELLEETARTGGHVCHQVISHQHLVLPGDIHSLAGDLTNCEVFCRRNFAKREKQCVFIDIREAGQHRQRSTLHAERWDDATLETQR